MYGCPHVATFFTYSVLADSTSMHVAARQAELFLTPSNVNLKLAMGNGAPTGRRLEDLTARIQGLHVARIQ